MDLLRFSTCGSVDDGKSTLIGRLLYDSKNIFEDQLEAVENSSRKRGDEYTNLALLTDGLRAEREQGITIDVAYRYFATPKRKFIIADTPGHIQYTRNMVTGASTAQLAIVLIDARKGVIEQTRRHSFIANLLRIKHIVLAVNKMDLVDWSEEAYNQIVSDFKEFASQFENIADITAIPLAALHGDNIVDKSESLPWYSGPTLLEHLETVEISHDDDQTEPRFPVQWVIRPMNEEYHDYRAYAGRVAGGTFNVGDPITVLPSGLESKISAIHTYEGDLESASMPLSVSISLEDEIDISRGDMLVNTNAQPHHAQEFSAMICWFSEKKLLPRGKYYLRHTTREVQAIVTSLDFKVNINTLEQLEEDVNFSFNDIGQIRVRTSAPLFFDTYNRNRITGSFILIDSGTNETVAAGMIQSN
jgi:sulfate adenylyltransferase subunit 1